MSEDAIIYQQVLKEQESYENEPCDFWGEITEVIVELSEETILCIGE